MTCDISHLNLNEVLDKGIKGELKSMSVDDWIFLEYLINKSGETQHILGKAKGYRNGYRDRERYFLQGDSYE